MCKNWLIAFVFGLGIFFLTSSTAHAQTSWEFSPYQIEIWLAAGEAPAISPQLLDSVAEGFRERAQIVANAAWEVHFSPVPPELAGDLLLPEYPPQFERLKTALADIAARDKLFLLHLNQDERGFVVQVRQFDVRSRSWDAIRETTTPQLEQLPFAAWDLVRQAFAPIVRVERVHEDQIDARIRAGGLVVNPNENPAAVQKGDALQPILRRNDRAGEPAKVAGINIVPWSVIQVNERADGVAKGTMFSGVRFPLPSRGGVRTERLAIKINPRVPATRLIVESKSAERQPMEGYEIYSKIPGAEDAQILGRTDWRGSFAIPPRETALQILYIRSGGKLLARLPLVTGSVEEAFVRLVDDQQRLQADGLIAAMHSRITDLVARREILAARIRNLVKQNKFEEAEALLAQFRQLETRTDLLKTLDEQQPTVRSSDKSTQARIEKMFADARKLLSKFLEPGTADTLNTEIQRAKANPTPVTPPAPITPETPAAPAVPETSPFAVPPPTTGPAT